MFDAAVGMKPNSTYTKFFKQALLDLINNGQMQKYRGKHSKSNAGCIPKRTRGTPLGLKKLVSVFAVPICGLILSLLISVIENCFRPRKKEIFQIMSFRQLLKLESTIVSSMPYMDGSLKMYFESGLEELQRRREMLSLRRPS